MTPTSGDILGGWVPNRVTAAMRKLWKVSTCARRQRECHAGPEASLARLWPDFGLRLQWTVPRRMCDLDFLLALLLSNCKSGGAPRLFMVMSGFGRGWLRPAPWCKRHSDLLHCLLLSGGPGGAPRFSPAPGCRRRQDLLALLISSCKHGRALRLSPAPRCRRYQDLLLALLLSGCSVLCCAPVPR